MVRIVKDYDQRFTEFVDVARELFYSKGYEQTSVQEIIDKVGVAKGTFYHYFDSKTALLDALVERLIGETLAVLQPVVADASLGALEKLTRFFAFINNWEVANRDFLIDMLRVFYRDENVLLYTKMQAKALYLVTPLLAQILWQGKAEGVFSVEHPDEAAEVLMELGQTLSTTIVPLLLASDYDQATVARVKRKVQLYERSAECVLGAPPASVCLVEPDVLDIWLPQ